MKRILALLWAVSIAVFGQVTAVRADFFEGPARAQALSQLSQLTKLAAEHRDPLMRLPGVVAFGVGLDRSKGELIFVVTVDDKQPQPSLPVQIEGVAIQVVSDSAALPLHAGHNTQQSLPVQMGYSGRTVDPASSCGACTMGFKACELATGDAVWVSAAHCASDGSTCPGSAPLGTRAYHTSPSDTPSCGLASDVGGLSAVAPPVAGGTVDAIAVDSDVTLTLSSVVDVGGVSVNAASVLPGDIVQKSGRTTNYTTGTVAAVAVAVNIGYKCGSIVLNDQIQISAIAGAFGLKGDSGAGVFNMNSPADIVGLLVAGNGTGTTIYANVAANVLTALGLSMNHTSCAEDSCPAIEVGSATANPDRTLSLLYSLRDEVLGASEVGKLVIRTFYSVAPAWVALYARDPQLFGLTQRALEESLPILRALVLQERLDIPAARVAAIDQLLQRHADAASKDELRQAFELFRKLLNDPEVQAEFGVSVH